MKPRILIAGIGNIFLGDDAFGCEVARRLAGRTLPDDVIVADFGIRGFDLAFALMDAPELSILVDALPRGEAPGTLFVVEPDPDTGDDAPAIDGHAMNPLAVFHLVRSLGGTLGRVLVLGCEPENLGGDEGKIGLSGPVQAAVDEAVAMVESLASRELPATTGGMS